MTRHWWLTWLKVSRVPPPLEEDAVKSFVRCVRCSRSVLSVANGLCTQCADEDRTKKKLRVEPERLKPPERSWPQVF